MNDFKRMQKLAGLITESQLNEAEPNIKKIGKYITIETGKYDDDYPDLDRQAISDYLESVIDPKYIKDVKTFMNDDEEGYDESRSYFFDEDDRYKDPSAIPDSEVEKWAEQEMSYYLFSQPDEFPSKGANKPYPKAPPRFSATSPLNKTSPKLLALLDAVEKDWGKNSDLGLDIAVFLITRQDENGELSPANKIAMKKLLSNYKLLNKYGHFLDENIDESQLNEAEKYGGQSADRGATGSEIEFTIVDNTPEYYTIDYKITPNSRYSSKTASRYNVREPKEGRERIKKDPNAVQKEWIRVSGDDFLIGKSFAKEIYPEEN